MRSAALQVPHRHDNGTTIRATTAPLFWPECGKCGGAMDLARVITGGKHRQLVFRCPADGITTVTTFARSAGRQARGRHPRCAQFLAGPAATPVARCGCGCVGPFALVDFFVAHEVEFSCVLIACGHEFQMDLPGTCDFDVEGGDHG